MEKKIAKIGIIMVLALALILSSLGALNFGDTFAKEFDVGAANETSVREWGGVSHSKLGASSNHLTAQAAETPVWSGGIATSFAGGDGSPEKPYLIATGEQLAYLAQQVNAVNTKYNAAHYKLTDDIVLNAGTINAGSTTAKKWTTIGYVKVEGTVIGGDRKYTHYPFNGTFDGNGHTVSGIYINDKEAYYQGLFGTVNTATVKNVGVINSYIKCKSSSGGVAGISVSSTITNCYNRGAVTGLYYLGGVVGSCENSAVINCYSTGEVKDEGQGATFSGGVAGYARKNSTIANCYFLQDLYEKINNELDVATIEVGVGATLMNSTAFGLDKKIVVRTITTNEDPTPENKALVMLENGADLLATLNAGVAAYNKANQKPAIQAAPWFEGKDGFPAYASVTIDPNIKAIYANGMAITLKAGGTTGFTNILVSSIPIDLSTLVGSTLTGTTTTGYDLSAYTVYGGGVKNTSATSVTMIGGKVKSIYGGGNVAAVNGDTLVTISGGTITGNVVGGGNGANVTKTKTVKVSGAPTIGTAATGIIINGGTPAVTDGVGSFVVNGALSGVDGKINIVLPTEYVNGTVATKEATLPVDVAKFVLVGAGATQKKLAINKTDSTKIDVVDDIIQLTKPDFVDPKITSLEYNGADQAAALKGLFKDFHEDKMTITAPVTATDVGDYTITVSILNTKLYQWADGTNTDLTLNTKITAKPITVTGFLAEKTYDGSLNVDISGAKLDGVIAGDTANVTLVNGLKATVADKTVGIGKAVTITDAFTLSGTKAKNYALTQPSNVKINITKRPLTVTVADASLTKDYDGNTTYSGGIAYTTNYTLNKIDGDNVTLTIGDKNFDYKDVAKATKVTIEYSNVLVGADSGNYSIVAGSFENKATITPKEFLASMFTIDVEPKVYGGATQDPKFAVSDKNGGATEIITADDFDVLWQYTGVVSRAAFSVGSATTPEIKNAGTYTVTVTPKGNYKANSSEIYSKVFTINQAKVTLTARNGTMVFGSTPILDYGYDVVGTIYADELGAITATTAANNTSNVGDHAITVKFAQNNNYNVTTKPGKLSITRKPIALPKIADNVYSGSEQVCNLTTTTEYTVGGITTGTACGNYTATVTPTGNYMWDGGLTASVEFTWKITKATPKLTVPTAVGIKYGQTLKDSVLTAGTATIIKGGTAETITVNGTFTWSAPDTNPTVTNSGYVVTFTPNASDEVNFTTATISTPIAVEKAVLTVTATDQNIIYGDPILQTAYTITGYQLTDDAGVVSGVPTLASDIKNVGKGIITATANTLAADNYSFAFADGAVTIGQRTITVSPIVLTGESVLTKEYDKNTTYSGELTKGTHYTLVNALEADDVNINFTTKLFNNANVGTANKVTASFDATLSGTKAANYIIAPASIELNAKLTKKALTVTGANVIIEKNYDGTTDVKTLLKKDKNYTITGFVDGESGDITVTAATYADKNVGEDKVITVTYALDTTTAVNYSSATSEMTLKGKIVSLSATEGTDYTVTSVGGEPVTVGGVKYFKDNYKITLIEGGKYNKISADEATLASGGKEIEVTGEDSTFTFYVKNDSGEIGQIIIQYGIDKTAPTIGESFTINGKASDVWVNGDKVTVSIGNILDTTGGSGIDWTDDGAANTRMTLKKGENAVAFVKNTALDTVSFDLNSKDSPINGVYVLTVYDYVGNSVSKTITIDKHDNVAPTIDLSAIDFTKWQGATTITPVVADTVVEGIASGIVEIKINGVVQNSVTFGANGRHDFVVEVKDDAGNVTKIDKMLLCDINIDLFNAKFSGNTPKDTQNASDARAIFNKLSNEAKLHISGNVASNIVASANYAGLLKYEEEQKEAIKTIQIAALKTAIDDAVATMTKDAVTSMKAANISADVFDGMGKDYQDKYNNVLTAMSVVNKLNSTVDNNSQLVGWVDTYDKLDEKVKTFVDVIIKADVVTTNKNNLTVVNAIKDKVDAIKMPVTSQNIEAAKTVVGEYDKLGNEIKKLVSVSTTEKLENLKKIIGKTNETQTIIDAIPDVVPSPLTDAYVDSVMKAKTAVDNLDNNVKSLVKTEKVDKGLAEIAKDETIKKNNDLASEIAKAIMKSNDSMTADKILECWKTYDSADTAIKALVDKMLPASFATLKTNAETAKTNVEAIKAIDLTKITSDNATRTEAEKVVAAINSLNAQTQKIVKNECGELLNEMIKLINAYEAITTLPSTDNKVDNCELCNGSVSGGVNHSTADHLKKIENAKKAFEKLNDKEKEKLGKELCDKINAQYNAMLNYVEQLNQSLKVKDNDKDISVYGIVTGVDQSNIPDVETAEEIFIKVNVEKTDSKIDEFTKTKIVSYDISLLGKTASATEFTKLQPKEHETVTVRMPIGSNFLVDTLEIYHVLNDGRRERIVNFTLSEINGQLYAIFDVSSFSEFFAYGETKNSTTDSDGGSGGTISGGDIFDKSIENEIKFKDTNSIVADVSNRENTLSKSILDAINEAESGKVVKVIFKEGEISITKEKLKGVALDKKSYTYAELKALIEVPEITPTPTPTPTEKPTEPTEPTEKKCWLCGACPMFLGICLWIWLAIAIVVVTVVVIIVVKKKKKDDEENEEDVKNKKK